MFHSASCSRIQWQLGIEAFPDLSLSSHLGHLSFRRNCISFKLAMQGISRRGNRAQWLFASLSSSITGFAESNLQLWSECFLLFDQIKYWWKFEHLFGLEVWKFSCFSHCNLKVKVCEFGPMARQCSPSSDEPKITGWPPWLITHPASWFFNTNVSANMRKANPASQGLVSRKSRWFWLAPHPQTSHARTLSTSLFCVQRTCERYPWVKHRLMTYLPCPRILINRNIISVSQLCNVATIVFVILHAMSLANTDSAHSIW